jgi:hypothetical protein
LVTAIEAPKRPPKPAPNRNAIREVRERGMESPGAPATANPRKTTFPVMFAVKTWPRPRKLTASTNPVTTVRA